jgi:predicted nucleic acid-binding protein
MLLDSNIFIYATQVKYESLRYWCISQKICASNITRLEVLGYHKLSEQDEKDFHTLFEKSTIYPVSSIIINQAISLRQRKSISIGDAIIAATALEYNETLVTRNETDFEWIEGLKIINPFDK